VNVYAKTVVHKKTDKVLGMHYAGPNAGEVMQGYAVAMRIGLTKQQLDSTIGIHPTCA
jgi:pyruvate/2-oxoglutarate dehydrogenase complex dihydrolipoamide dehydrogenase (E3) component